MPLCDKRLVPIQRRTEVRADFENRLMFERKTRAAIEDAEAKGGFCVTRWGTRETRKPQGGHQGFDGFLFALKRRRQGY